MKFETTRKAMSQKARFLIMTRRDLNILFMGAPPQAFNRGYYGWNCDYYILENDGVLCCGYRPHGYFFKEVETLIEHYISMVEPIYNDYNIPYTQKLEFIYKHRSAFANELYQFLHIGGSKRD